MSRICAALDAEVAAFRDRSLAGERYPYVWLDATYLKVREAGRVVSMAALVAIGVARTGSAACWARARRPATTRATPGRASCASLVERGLAGVRLVISDAHRWHRRGVPGAPGRGVAALIGPHCPGTKRSRLAPGGECLGNDDRLKVPRQTRASARVASPHRPEGDVLRAPIDERPGWAAPAARRASRLEGTLVDVFVGLDWGEQHHQVHALDATGRRLLELRVAHDHEGLAQLRAALATLGAPGEVGIAIERREGLLVEHLLAWGHPVYPVNPKVAARAREGYRAAPVKSDALDAFSLADLLRRQVDVWRPLRLPSETLSELQALVRDRERFVVEHRRVQHQLRAILATYYPGLTHLFELARPGHRAGLPAPLSQS